MTMYRIVGTRAGERLPRIWLKTVSLLSVALIVGGCQAFLPAHSLSEDTRQEQLSIRMLTAEEILSEYADRLTDSDKELITRPPLVERDPSLLTPGGLIGTALVLARDYVATALEVEAARYVAQYETSAALDGFWTTRDLDFVQAYRGIEFKRLTGGNPEDFGGLTVLLLIYPSTDNQFLGLKPAIVQLRTSKAKVPSYEIKDWWTTFWTWALRTGDSVDLDFELRIAATYRAGARSRTVETKELGAFSFNSNGHLLGTERNTFAQAIGWIPPIPRSADPLLATRTKGLGTFQVSFRVTEADTSRAAELLTLGAKKVKDFDVPNGNDSSQPGEEQGGGR